jgi:hypothetical protein
MLIYFPIIFLVMAAFFLTIGIKVVAGRKPVLLSSRFFYGFLLIAFSPQFVNAATMITGHGSFFFWISPIMFAALLVFFWFQLKGYMVIGVHDDTFRDALLHTLGKNNMPYEERLSTILLPDENAALQVAIQSWIGAGQIKLKHGRKKALLKQIVAGINDYYATNQTKPNRITAILYIVIGLFMVVSAGAFFATFLTISKHLG